MNPVVYSYVYESHGMKNQNSGKSRLKEMEKTNNDHIPQLVSTGFTAVYETGFIPSN
jgi:hypothetical protein